MLSGSLSRRHQQAASYLSLPALIFIAAFAGSGLRAQPAGAREMQLTVGKSLIVDSPVNIQRVAVGDGKIADAVVTTPREVLVNGLAPGATTLIIWQATGSRQVFDLNVTRNMAPVEAIRRQIRGELPNQDITIDWDNDSPIVKGTATDLTSAERALVLASTLGKPINLLKINVPGTDAQILIKVRFANVDRVRSTELGLNLFSTGATNTIGATSTQQFSPLHPEVSQDQGATKTTFSLADALNIFLFRPDLNLGATIKALQAKRLLEILAEPNVLTMNGRPASFLAGGEFPFPTLQGGGAGLGSVTIQFREFGIRINFTPTMTPLGTIRMQVAPEVSSLDFSNGLVFQGFSIPALSTRRVSTEVELESGQTFAIGGLLDNRVQENLSKVPGLGDIPFFGKLFRSKQLLRSNTELLVLVTPEFVRPIPAGQPQPDLKMPEPFLPPNTSANPPRTPPISVTGMSPAKPAKPAIPMEELLKSIQPQPGIAPQGGPQIQFVPMPIPPPQAQGTRPAAPAPAVPAPATPTAAAVASGGRE